MPPITWESQGNFMLVIVDVSRIRKDRIVEMVKHENPKVAYINASP